MPGCILLHQQDLRIEDHAALHAARSTYDWVCPVFVWDPDGERPWSPGGASRWWLHHSLAALVERYESRGAALVLRSGELVPTVQSLVEETGAEGVVWSVRPEPHAGAMQEKLRKALEETGVRVEAVPGPTLFEPSDVLTKEGRPFQVFTPYWRACVARIAETGLPDPLPTPRQLTPPPKKVKSDSLASLRLLPKIPWDVEFGPTWTPGEEGAHRRLWHTLSIVGDYVRTRNRPDIDGTSALSPHLHFGEITPKQIVHAVLGAFGLPPEKMSQLPDGPRTFLTEIGWREFAHSVLHHFPHTDRAPLKPQFEKFPWTYNRKDLTAWQKGLTGYPIVDAGMRQLWRTGWMHNRVRMIVGSFLTKDLLQTWQSGAEWFWDTLVDADLPNNSLGWQWVSGSGADASPYFRVFNPVGQGKKFDPEGAYVRQWVPELAKLPTEFIHDPWEANPEILKAAGVILGDTYPEPMVDHAAARVAALEALSRTKAER